MLWWSLGMSMTFCLDLRQHAVLRWFLCLSLMRWLSRESQEVSVVAAEATLLTMIASGPHCALLPLWAPPAVDGVAVAELALGAAVGLELLLELRLWIRVVLLKGSMSYKNSLKERNAKSTLWNARCYISFVKVKRFKKIAWFRPHHLHLQWKFKFGAGKLASGVKAKHCWTLSTNFLP